ncbi:hypothetical protein [Roseovarius mucosus]|uniref:hypothetical protein n=1 Tax=Roseovarius mucosus TaxID=215743 RepID=UPI00197D1739|nr:hypothetical protein [Roseovarius mucosus]
MRSDLNGMLLACRAEFPVECISEGASQLKLAYQKGSCHAGRRLGLTMQDVGVLEHGLRHCSTSSQSRYDRYGMLAALNFGMTRPLLAVAFSLRNDPAAETRLCVAFPHRRKLLDRRASIAGDLPCLGTANGEKHTDRSPGQPHAHHRYTPA